MRINGTPDVVANRIREYVHAGADYFILGFYLGDEDTIFDIEAMELFMDEVKKRI
jgi:alkanesulfonate monooxygenase SsuD/methylene tetrahydromethanopterin reductase-like flavin-dependent oxidoreductase (luciferase family)